MRFYTDSELGRTRRLTPEGFLVVESVPIARTGSMDYHPSETPGIDPGDNGLVTMFRTPEELFSAETVASFEGKPVIIPTEGRGHAYTIDADTWRKTAVGHVQGVRRGSGEQDGFLVADIVVNDATAIERVNAGLRELSCGYEYLTRPTGKGVGEQYEIRGNHVALVSKARGGSQLKIGDKGIHTMKTKNPLLKLFFFAAKAGDEETAQSAANEIDAALSKTAGDSSQQTPATAGDAMSARIDKLEAGQAEILALLKSKAGDGEKASEDDEGKEKADDAKTCGDAEWQELVSGAAIIAPTFQAKREGKLADIKRAALAMAGDPVKVIAGDMDIGKADAGAVGLLFRAVVSNQKALNNANQTAGDGGQGNPMTFSGLSGGFEIVGR